MAASDYMTCSRCGISKKAETSFYKRKDRDRVDICKDCLTRKLDPAKEETFLWILEKMDVPYIPIQWRTCIDAIAKTKGSYAKVTGQVTLGRYLSKMKLSQWSGYGWADTEVFKKEEEEKREKEEAERAKVDAEWREKFEKGEITEAEFTTMVSTKENMESASLVELLHPSDREMSSVDESDNPYNEKKFKDENFAKLDVNLTEDDEKYLFLKWGRLYNPNDWVILEKSYEEMARSFDIADADTANTLILICKTNLKMNQALDCGDIEGYQKLAKVSSDLRKSAKFTAAQNKEEKGDFVDCIGTMVSYCEEHGGKIPRFDLSYPQDIIDVVIKDLKNYTKSLISEDISLAKQIEDYLKKKELMEKQEETRVEEFETGEVNTVKDEDYIEYNKMMEELSALERGNNNES